MLFYFASNIQIIFIDVFYKIVQRDKFSYWGWYTRIYYEADPPSSPVE